jgi:hypothetical protein
MGSMTIAYPARRTHARGVPWRAWLPRRRYFIAARVAAADDIPARLPRRAMVIAGPTTAPTWIAFDCPCAERHRILLRLRSQPGRPAWQLATGRRPTLFPSVDAHTGQRRCHFWIRKGRITWVQSSHIPHDQRPNGGSAR